MCNTHHACQAFDFSYGLDSCVLAALLRSVVHLVLPLCSEQLLTNDVSTDTAQTPEEKGDVDPFVEFILYDPVTRDSQKQESSKLPNEPNPKWGEKFDFVMVSAPSILTVNVWDTLNWLEGRLSVKGLTGRSFP